jgi:mono/diheme cytochrome c family protein
VHKICARSILTLAVPREMRMTFDKRNPMSARRSIGIPALAAALLAASAVHAQERAADIGRAEYLASCAVCHGVYGKGDGPFAAQLKKAVPDLTVIQKSAGGMFPFDRIYDMIDGREAVLAHGPRDMPVWGRIFAMRAREQSGGSATESFTRGEILALVGYIYSLQAK